MYAFIELHNIRVHMYYMYTIHAKPYAAFSGSNTSHLQT